MKHLGRNIRAVAVVATILVGTVVPSLPASAAVWYTAVQSGDWDDPATWGGSLPSLAADTVNVNIPSGISVIVPADVTVEFTDDVLLLSGSLFSAGTLVAQPGTNIEITNEGHLSNFNTFSIDSHSVNGTFLQSTLKNLGTFVNSWTFELDGFSEMLNQGTLWNSGEIQMKGVFSEIENRGGTFENRGIFENYAGSVSSGHSGELVNNGGTVLNTDAGLIKLGGSLTNLNWAGTTGLVENHGTIAVMNDDKGHLGTLVNTGFGAAVIDNYGIIESASSTGNSNIGNDHLIRNRPGAEIRTLSRFGISSGKLINENGGTIRILAPHGKLENRRIIDNDGLIENGNIFDNTGSGILIVRCNSSITGNAVLGDDIRDYCDSVPPTITVPSPITAEATAPSGGPISYRVRTTDDKDPFPSLSCNPYATSAYESVFPLGTTTVDCTSTDRVGNTSSASFTVTVVDTTPPVIAILGDHSAVVVQNNQYLDAEATAVDLVDGDLTSSIVVTNPVDATVLGFYTVTYDVSDTRGNAASASRSVEVITPAEATDRLITHAQDLSVSEATRDDLLRSLTRASQLLHDGQPANDRSVCQLMSWFDNAVRRHEANGDLTSDQAAELLERAGEIQMGLGCP